MPEPDRRAEPESDPSPGRLALLPRLDAHIPALDGVRGVAVLLVLGSHFMIDLKHRLGLAAAGVVTRTVLGAWDSGWIGVDLFFVLSGFLITGILYESREKEGYFRIFYMRRSLRIFPLYYGLLAFAFLIAPSLGFPGIARAIGPNQGYFWFYGVNFLLARGEGFPLSHFWTLAVEEHYYLVWPLVVLLFSRRALMGVCVALAVVAALCRLYAASHWNVLAAYVLTPCRMDSLAIGSLAALACRGPGGLAAVVPGARVVAVLGIASLGLLALPGGGLSPLDPTVQLAGFPLVSITCAALLIASIPAGGPVNRLCDLRPLRSIGKYSYGMYVYHGFLMSLVAKTFPVERVEARTGSSLVSAGLYLGLGVALTYLVAWASFVAFEQPILRLKRHFSYAPRPSAPPPRPVEIEVARPQES